MAETQLQQLEGFIILLGLIMMFAVMGLLIYTGIVIADHEWKAHSLKIDCNTNYEQISNLSYLRNITAFCSNGGLN